MRSCFFLFPRTWLWFLCSSFALVSNSKQNHDSAQPKLHTHGAADITIPVASAQNMLYIIICGGRSCKKRVAGIATLPECMLTGKSSDARGSSTGRTASRTRTMGAFGWTVRIRCRAAKQTVKLGGQQRYWFW